MVIPVRGRSHSTQARGHRDSVQNTGRKLLSESLMQGPTEQVKDRLVGLGDRLSLA